MFACLFQGDVATTACMSSCKHLATKLKSYLVNDEVGKTVLDYVHTMPAHFEKGEKCGGSRI